MKNKGEPNKWKPTRPIQKSKKWAYVGARTPGLFLKREPLYRLSYEGDYEFFVAIFAPLKLWWNSSQTIQWNQIGQNPTRCIKIWPQFSKFDPNFPSLTLIFKKSTQIRLGWPKFNPNLTQPTQISNPKRRPPHQFCNDKQSRDKLSPTKKKQNNSINQNKSVCGPMAKTVRCQRIHRGSIPRNRMNFWCLCSSVGRAHDWRSWCQVFDPLRRQVLFSFFFRSFVLTSSLSVCLFICCPLFCQNYHRPTVVFVHRNKKQTNKSSPPIITHPPLIKTPQKQQQKNSNLINIIMPLLLERKVFVQTNNNKWWGQVTKWLRCCIKAAVGKPARVQIASCSFSLNIFFFGFFMFGWLDPPFFCLSTPPIARHTPLGQFWLGTKWGKSQHQTRKGGHNTP